MGRKRTPGDFNHNPFSSLEGLSVSKGEKERKPPDTKPPAPRQTPEAESRRGDDLDFLEAMHDLGVTGRGGKRKSSGARRQTGKPAEETDEEARAMMLDALGSMDVCFIDPAPPEDEGQRAQPRRMRRVERGEVVPTAELDLHHVPSEGAVQRVAWFLQDALHQGHEVVRLITGAGHHSQNGPVIRPLVEQYLSSEEGRVRVVEWGRAPQRHGGAGALIVFLKK